MPDSFPALPRSTFFKSFRFTGERIGYPDAAVMGDTYPMTWADDGEIYTSAGDPQWGETKFGLDTEKFTGGPTDYKITKTNHMNDYTGWGGDGPKPTGMICVDGILYLAFQNLQRAKLPVVGIKSQHGSDAQIIYSINKGFFWIPALGNIKEPMFAGHKFGGPAFVNFGQNNANARDGFVYAVSSDQWDNGSNLRLGRVPKDRIMDRAAWEFVYAFDGVRAPAWTKSLDDAIPILSLYQWISAPELVYIAALKRYLLLSWHLHEDFSPTAGTDLLVLESPEPWGPFSLVHHEVMWEGKAFNPYTPRVPLKWMAADGLSGWLQFSGSWADMAAGYYRSNVRAFQLELA
jgi:hypothetical protein